MSLDLAARLLKAGRPAEAIAPLREAARLQPGNALIRHDLGLACLEAGFPMDAADSFRAAIALKPRYTDAVFRLGLALERLGDTAAAIAAYDRATELLPSHTEAWFRAGALVETLGHRDEAAGCFRRAAASGPKTSFGRLATARALLIEAQDEAAEKSLRRALALDPKNVMAMDLLGNLLADGGRFEEARTMFARAIDQAPLMAGAYYDLVRCRRLGPEDADLLDRIGAALETPGLDESQRLRLFLARGKAADDLGDYRLAMQAFDAADALRRASQSFDPAEFDAQIDRLMALFPKSRFDPRSGSSDATPLVIIGLPRSGTTLVEQVLSSHPKVAAGGELNFWNETAPGLIEADPSRVDQAGAAYLASLRAISPAALRITDKMPFNFLWAGLIHAAFPRATIIHCRRAAIDTALSIHQTLFNPHLAFPTGGPELVAYVRSYERLSEYWRRTLPAERFVEIRYEELTAAPERVIPALIGACGLDWDAACLRPEHNPRIVKTASKWQARQPIYRTAVDRWRRYEPWLGALEALRDE